MSTPEQTKCPFSVGQIVVYRPTQRGLDADVMSSESERLTPDKAYRIAEIRQELYVVPEGYKHPGGGIYWTEFAPQ